MAWTEAETASMSFTSQLMTHVRSPQEQKSLPPMFVINFVNRCFHPSLELVDFPQALTALDYLRDLENRRRREMTAAFERVHIHSETYDSDMQTMAEKFPGIALWVRNIEGKNQKAEHYYAMLWLSLRRWIMINELSQPFNKINCMGMLNTLLPPMTPQTKLPSPQLQAHTLTEEREGFFEYIRQVQKNGPKALQPVIDMNRGPQDATGWPTVHKIVEKYTRMTKQMLDDCQATTGPETFDRFAGESRKSKKTDSGVSFGSERRPSVGPSIQEMHPKLPTSSYASSTKGISKLERITREFRRMRVKSRPEVEEIVHLQSNTAAEYIPQPASSTGRKSLKKAKSLASLKFNSSSLSLAGSRQGSDAATAAFDPAQMAKARALYESRNGHA